jgi:hypothetical protein
MRSEWFNIVPTLVIVSASISMAVSCKHNIQPNVSNPAMTDEMEVNTRPDDAISTTVQCQFRCINKNLQTKSKLGVYEPANRGLKPGNGNMWGSLTSDLQFYAQEICLASAKESCGSLAKIDVLAAVKVSSGTWSMNLPVPCKPSAALLSPFQPDSGALMIIATNNGADGAQALPAPRARPRRNSALIGLKPRLVLAIV